MEFGSNIDQICRDILLEVLPKQRQIEVEVHPS